MFQKPFRIILKYWNPCDDPSGFDWLSAGTQFIAEYSFSSITSVRLEGDYALFPISPDNKQGLEDLLAQRSLRRIFTGLNVTIPHKQNVIPFLDELTSTAQAIGAVNTIYCRNDKLIGDNTDADGFLLDLKRFIGNRESKIANRKSALILGAGGSARAVVYALINDGWNVGYCRVVELNRRKNWHLDILMMSNPLSLPRKSNLPNSARCQHHARWHDAQHQSISVAG